MKHAEAIAERVVQLGGRPTLELIPVELGNTPAEILEIDNNQETEAIRLYTQIIALADKNNDAITKELFKKLLNDEEKHLKTFSDLLKH